MGSAPPTIHSKVFKMVFTDLSSLALSISGNVEEEIENNIFLNLRMKYVLVLKQKSLKQNNIKHFTKLSHIGNH